MLAYYSISHVQEAGISFQSSGAQHPAVTEQKEQNNMQSMFPCIIRFFLSYTACSQTSLAHGMSNTIHAESKVQDIQRGIAHGQISSHKQQ